MLNTAADGINSAIKYHIELIGGKARVGGQFNESTSKYLVIMK